MYYADVKNKGVVGFYLEDINGIDKCNLIFKNGGIKVDEELHQYLLNLGQSKFIGVREERLYTLADKALFEKIIPPVDNTPQPKSQIEILQETVDALVLSSLGV